MTPNKHFLPGNGVIVKHPNYRNESRNGLVLIVTASNNQLGVNYLITIETMHKDEVRTDWFSSNHVYPTAENSLELPEDDENADRGPWIGSEVYVRDGREKMLWTVCELRMANAAGFVGETNLRWTRGACDTWIGSTLAVLVVPGTTQQRVAAYDHLEVSTASLLARDYRK